MKTVKIKGHWERTHYYTAEVEIDEEKFKSMSYYELREYILENGEIVEDYMYPDDEINFKLTC